MTSHNALTLSATDPLIGRVVDGRYRVLEPIGSGGMGRVYLAEHLLIRRKVALKTLQMGLGQRRDGVARLRREAISAASVGNPHVVDMLDMGRLDDGTHYIVMEWLSGHTLAEAVSRSGVLGMERSIRIMMQLCHALGAVHGVNIIHRDLKPENVILIERGGERDFVKLLDFGICKVLERERDDVEQITRTGVAIGTPHFMAPEQIDVLDGIDLRADIYAVGAMLFYMLSGTTPFDAPTLPQLFLRICSDQPRALRTLRPAAPAALDQLVARCLAKRRDARFPDSAALHEALGALLPQAQAADAEEAATPSLQPVVAGRRHGTPAGEDSRVLSTRARGQTAPTLVSGQHSSGSVTPTRPWLRALLIGVTVSGLLFGLVGAVISALVPGPPDALPAPEHRVGPRVAPASGDAPATPPSASTGEADEARGVTPPPTAEANDARAVRGNPDRPSVPRPPAVHRVAKSGARPPSAPVAPPGAAVEDAPSDVGAQLRAADEAVVAAEPASPQGKPPTRVEAFAPPVLPALQERPLMEVFLEDDQAQRSSAARQ